MFCATEDVFPEPRFIKFFFKCESSFAGTQIADRPIQFKFQFVHCLKVMGKQWELLPQLTDSQFGAKMALESFTCSGRCFSVGRIKDI